MLHVVVLGAAAGGGLPQWNCDCDNCRTARESRPELRSTQASIAVSATGRDWFLINASPDLRQQIVETPALHPRGSALRDSPISGVILTNGEVDAVAGLLTLREGWPFTIYAHDRVLDVLAANSIFNVLDPARVRRRAIAPGMPFEPALADGTPSGLVVEPILVRGKAALYLESDVSAGAVPDAEDGDTIALRISDTSGEHHFFFIGACAELEPHLADRLSGAPLAFFDGTLWHDDEMIRMGLSQKTGARMGHMAMQGSAGAMAALEPLNIERKIFIHINNSNPVWLPDSPERQAAEAAGWEIPADGMRITV